MVLEWIDFGDSQAETNGAVGGAAASLGHDIVFAAKLHKVGDNQEVSGKTEPLDQSQLMLDLLSNFVGHFAVTVSGPGVGAQNLIHPFARAVGYTGIVNQIGESELQTLPRLL
jgi:hypothetical protein